jgi:hypothetical protein
MIELMVTSGVATEGVKARLYSASSCEPNLEFFIFVYWIFFDNKGQN